MTPTTEKRAGASPHPVLVVTGAEEAQLADAGDVWRRWAVTVGASTVPGGHFVPEESRSRYWTS